MDPIADLAKLAIQYDIRLHVDACLGGFTVPFVKELGYPVPAFDFAVEGVTSISADLHKYAFAAKGVSALLYRHKDIRKYQYFAYGDWPGGLFISPSATGTRPGGAIASAWAALKYIGREGYLEITKGVLETTRKLIAGIEAISDLYVLGKPVAGVFAFGSDTLDVHALSDILESRGWHIDQQVNPSCLHFMVTPAHAQAADPFLRDLRESVAELKIHPDRYQGGSAAMYGMSLSVPDRAVVDGFIREAYGDFMREGGEFSFAQFMGDA